MCCQLWGFLKKTFVINFLLLIEGFNPLILFSNEQNSKENLVLWLDFLILTFRF